jgi:hypothetical protein
MATAIYETQLVCDNCGSIVTRQRVDQSHFDKLAAQTDPALPQPGVDGSPLVDDGDLISVDAGRPVEVLLEHVAVCGRCSGSP